MGGKRALLFTLPTQNTPEPWVSQQQQALPSSKNTSQGSTGSQAEEMLRPTVLSMRNPPQPFSGGNSTRHSLLQADFQQPEPESSVEAPPHTPFSRVHTFVGVGTHTAAVPERTRWSEHCVRPSVSQNDFCYY